MNPTLFEIGVAAIMLAVSVALVVWFWRDMAVASARRTRNMLVAVGVDNIGRDTKAMQNVLKRCRRCPSEGLCERWLAGGVEGDNGFCPNAKVFRKL